MPPKPKVSKPSGAQGAKPNKPKAPVVAGGRGRGTDTKPPAVASNKATTKGRGAPSRTTAKEPPAAKLPTKSTWGPKDDSARKIQTAFRAYMCRKLLRQLQQKKQEYDQTIERLQREAFVQIVKIEREKAAKEAEKREQELRKKHEENNRFKRFLEAAFDGSNDDIKAIYEEVRKSYAESNELTVNRHLNKLIECSDLNNNTALSEAAAGGNPDTIRLLLSLGANPNSKGQYGRSPLYRAAFAGHSEAVKVLLEGGGDPRNYADDGATPEQVSCKEGIIAVFQEWDIEKTEAMLLQWEKAVELRRLNDTKLWKSQEDQLQSEINEAQKENSAKQKQLMKAHEELNKRINEHDKCIDVTKHHLTLTAIHDAEDWLEKCKLDAQTAKEKMQKAKLNMRLKRNEFQSDEILDESESEIPYDLVITIREMDDVLMKDVGNKITDSNKWPLIIDPSKQSSTFLKYRDTNYLSVVSPKHMEPETIRRSLLGAIRFGKFLVLDLVDIEDMWPSVVRKFDDVQKDLMSSLLNKDFLKDEKYLKLIRSSDGEQYSPMQFLSARIHNFKVVILTQLFEPPQELIGITYLIKIHVPEPLLY